MLKLYNMIEGRLSETKNGSGVVYVYIKPDEHETGYLINELKIDEHTYNSALDPDELGRLEFEPNHIAVIIKCPKKYTAADNFLFKVSSLGLFLFSDKIIIVSNEDNDLFDSRIFQKLNSVSDVFLKAIFRCVQHFEEHLGVIHKVSNELETEINQALTNKDLLYMFSLEKSLVYYLKAISSNSRVIEKIKANSAKMSISQEQNEFLEDMIIEATQCNEEANIYLQVISNMMDAWVSMVSNNLNFRMKTLTILSICIMLPTFIVSLFSMNVKLPIPQQESLVSFWFISALAALSVMIIAVFWWRKKW
ncbi:MAG TPA: magnesium transporter CorA family protein [Candidatus Omnitrophota bacterium]|nr:magnesium transporter CorA family protein [Candidatus Omnitrophota bacterium]